MRKLMRRSSKDRARATRIDETDIKSADAKHPNSSKIKVVISRYLS